MAINHWYFIITSDLVIHWVWILCQHSIMALMYLNPLSIFYPGTYVFESSVNILSWHLCVSILHQHSMVPLICVNLMPTFYHGTYVCESGVNFILWHLCMWIICQHSIMTHMYVNTMSILYHDTYVCVNPVSTFYCGTYVCESCVNILFIALMCVNPIPKYHSIVPPYDSDSLIKFTIFILLYCLAWFYITI